MRTKIKLTLITLAFLLLLHSCQNNKVFNEFLKKYPKIHALGYSWELTYSVGNKRSLTREYSYALRDTTYRLIFSRIYKSDLCIDLFAKQYTINDSMYILSLNGDLDTLYYFKERKKAHYFIDTKTVNDKRFLYGKEFFIKAYSIE